MLFIKFLFLNTFNACFPIYTSRRHQDILIIDGNNLIIYYNDDDNLNVLIFNLNQKCGVAKTRSYNYNKTVFYLTMEENIKEEDSVIIPKYTFIIILFALKIQELLILE